MPWEAAIESACYTLLLTLLSVEERICILTDLEVLEMGESPSWDGFSQGTLAHLPSPQPQPRSVQLQAVRQLGSQWKTFSS